MGHVLDCNIHIKASVPTTRHDRHLHMVLYMRTLHLVCSSGLRVIMLLLSALVGMLNVAWHHNRPSIMPALLQEVSAGDLLCDAFVGEIH